MTLTDRFTPTTTSSLFTIALFSLLLLFSATAAIPAYAQDLSDEELQQFEDHVRQATAAMDRGDYRGAISGWESAMELVDHPRIRIQLAMAHAKYEDCAPAHEVASNLPDHDQLDEEVQRDHQRLEALLEECPDTGEVYFECTPAELTIEVDDGDVPCGEWVELPEGDHAVSASQPGFESDSYRITVAAGQRTREPVTLESAAADATSNRALYAGMGTTALGVVFMGFAVGQEFGAAGRAEEMMQARDDADYARMEDLRDDAASSARRATVGYVVGTTFIAAGSLVMWYASTGSDDTDTSAAIGVGAGTIELRLTFP